MDQYLIAANTKKGKLIFNIFRPIDLGIIGSGTVITFIMFLIMQPKDLFSGIIVLLPFLICAFLVLPVSNYHNMLCILQNIYNFYFVDMNRLKWRGWCCKDEFKD